MTHYVAPQNSFYTTSECVVSFNLIRICNLANRLASAFTKEKLWLQIAKHTEGQTYGICVYLVTTTRVYSKNSSGFNRGQCNLVQFRVWCHSVLPRLFPKIWLMNFPAAVWMKLWIKRSHLNNGQFKLPRSAILCCLLSVFKKCYNCHISEHFCFIWCSEIKGKKGRVRGDRQFFLCNQKANDSEWRAACINEKSFVWRNYY